MEEEIQIKFYNFVLGGHSSVLDSGTVMGGLALQNPELELRDWFVKQCF